MNSDLKKLTEDFLKFEIEEKLFDDCLFNIKYWDYIRQEVYYELISQKALPPLVWPQKAVLRKKSQIINKYLNEFFSLPFFIIGLIINRIKNIQNNKVDIIIFEDNNKSNNKPVIIDEKIYFCYFRSIDDVCFIRAIGDSSKVSRVLLNRNRRTNWGLLPSR